MMNTVLTKTYKEIPFDKKEIIRYAKADGNDSMTCEILNECISEISDRLSYKVCYSRFKIDIRNGIDMGFTRVLSKDLSKMLKDCDEIILFAATIGMEIDRMIAKYGRISPVRALFFQAIGAERIESLCNAFCKDIKKDLNITPRFSPGFGDLPLELQKDIFFALQPHRNIGLTLNESLLMSPSKSVTAIIGIKR